MRDRFMNGFISGLVAGIVSTIVDYIVVNMVKFGEIRFVDFAGVFIFGERPHGIQEILFAQIGAFLFHGLLGIIFAYLITKITSRYFYTKCILYGTMIWFGIYALTMLFKVPHLIHTPLHSAIKDTLNAAFFGIVLGRVYLWLKGRERTRVGE